MNKLLLVVLCLSSPLAQAEGLDTYLCITTQATGFAFDGRQWRNPAFSVGDEIFIIKEFRDGEQSPDTRVGYLYGAFKVGAPHNSAQRCTIDSGYVHCGNSFTSPQTHLSLDNGRFIQITVGDYLTEGVDPLTQEPYIGRGKCTKI